jgi:hypothetical protein
MSSRISEMIKHFARPGLVDRELVKKAVAMKPRALQTKIRETVPYVMS